MCVCSSIRFFFFLDITGGISVNFENVVDVCRLKCFGYTNILPIQETDWKRLDKEEIDYYVEELIIKIQKKKPQLVVCLGVKTAKYLLKSDSPVDPRSDLGLTSYSIPWINNGGQSMVFVLSDNSYRYKVSEAERYVFNILNSI